jgi:NAD(P)-dependent dehydrogenase (short-subunit alcohol dehydrogenase family)
MNTIIITGGTSDIGFETIKLLKENYDIVFSFNKNLKKAKKIEKEFNVLGLRLNLENNNSIHSFFKSIQRKKIFSLIHIAAEKSDRKELEKMNEKKIIKLINANCIGSTILLKKTLELMKKNTIKNKSITMISSQAAKFGGNKISVYAASKAYLDGLNLSLSKELPKSIKINNITLGKIITSGFKKTFQKNLSLTKDVPMKRLGKPIEVAHSIKLLIENFNYLSGADIKLTGGR